jgi:hypothetical protein
MIRGSMADHGRARRPEFAQFSSASQWGGNQVKEALEKLAELKVRLTALQEGL